MPVYVYEARDENKSCQYCRDGFECQQRLSDAPLEHCPECGHGIRKAVVAIRVGRSVSALDDRAREAGFTKLKRLGKGEYEKQY